MGTTRDAIRSENCELTYVLAIEGYEYIITDGLPADAVTAWAATSWTKALPGLEVNGTFNQSLAPWSNEVRVPTFRFVVRPEETDQFGIDMFRAKPAIRSELTVGFGTGDSAGGGFNINVKDAAVFPAGAPVTIGNETFNVTGTPSGTTIPVATNGSGYLAPFGTSAGPANSFPGPHSVPATTTVGAYESATPVWVASAPATWIGKKVALHVHRVSGGVLDTRAESELWFAGTISRVSEDGLATVVECDGIQRALVDATLMQDQWTGQVGRGYTFEDGDWVKGLFLGSTLSASAQFVAGTDFDSGYYTVEEFGSVLANLLDADSSVGVSGSDISLRWSSHITSSSAGPRFTLTTQEATSHTGKVGIASGSKEVLEFFGFDDIWQDNTQFGTWGANSTGTDIAIVAIVSPRTSDLAEDANGEFSLTINGSSGTFVDHTDILPPQAREHVTGAEVWSYYILGGKLLVLGRRDSDTKISKVTTTTPVSRLTNKGISEEILETINEDASIRQVFFSSDTFTNTIAKLFASVDGNGENESTYDTLPFGAGIPWELLGQNFLDSLAALEQSGSEDSISLIVEKPTRLWDAIRSDFALRMAAPVWKDGGIQIAQLTVPNASTSDFTLTEANKSTADRTRSQQTAEYLAHTLKVEINRNPITDKYQDHFIARDKVGYESAGGAGATKTIKARNSYRGVLATGSSAELLADTITARFLPVFSKELRTWRRSIPHTLFHMAPGDTVTLSDDTVRDPSTGAHGITNRPAIVLAVRHSLGISSGGQGYVGEVDLLYTEEDRLFECAPSAEHATVTTTGAGRNWTAGYDDEVGTTGIFSMLVQQNAFSAATEPNDSESFAENDVIVITEQDPANPTSADSFQDVVRGVNQDVATGYDEIVFTDGFGNAGNPAFDSTKTYLVNFASYDQVLASQQLVSYQADDVDGQILDTAEPNLVGDGIKLGGAAADLTLLPARHSAEQFGDGVPLSSSFVRAQSRMANNLINYKTAPHSPYLIRGGTGTIVSSATATTYVAIWTFPYYIGNENWSGSSKRVLNIAPMFRSGLGGTTVNVRVTSAANPPNGEDSSWTDTNWRGPKNQVTFSSSSETYAVATAQELDVVRAEGDPEYTWITMEGGNLSQTLGLAELWLGAIQ